MKRRTATLLAIALLALVGAGLLLQEEARAPRPEDDPAAARTPGEKSEPRLLSGVAPQPGQQPNDGSAPAERDGASEPPTPTVRRFRPQTPKGWVRRHDLGCRLILTSAPAWYSYDESHWQPGGVSLRDEYPSERYPSLEGAVALLTIVGRIATGASAHLLEAALCVDGVEVADLGVGGTSANIIGFTGGPPAVRWNIPLDPDLLALLSEARWAEIRFRPRRLTRDEELSQRRPVQINDRRITMREYIGMQRPPGAVEIPAEALAEIRSLR